MAGVGSITLEARIRLACGYWEPTLGLISLEGVYCADKPVSLGYFGVWLSGKRCGRLLHDLIKC